MEKEVKTNKISRFRLFLAVIILLSALNVFIGNFLLMLPGNFSLKTISFFRFLTVPGMIIPNLCALYATFVAILLLRSKKKNLIEILLVPLLILMFCWLFWRAFLFYVLSVLVGLIELALSLTAIVAMIIYFSKEGDKSNEN